MGVAAAFLYFTKAHHRMLRPTPLWFCFKIHSYCNDFNLLSSLIISTQNSIQQPHLLHHWVCPSATSSESTTDNELQALLTLLSLLAAVEELNSAFAIPCS